MTGGADHPIELEEFRRLGRPTPAQDTLSARGNPAVVLVCRDQWRRLLGRSRPLWKDAWRSCADSCRSNTVRLDDQLGIVFARLDAQRSSVDAWVERFTEAVRGGDRRQDAASFGSTTPPVNDPDDLRGVNHNGWCWASNKWTVQRERDSEALRVVRVTGQAVVTDSMHGLSACHCQIVAQGGEYRNQGSCMRNEEQSGLAGCRVTVHETCEKDHGAWRPVAWWRRNRSTGCTTATVGRGCAASPRLRADVSCWPRSKVEEETRYYLSSLPKAERQYAAIGVSKIPCTG